VTDILLRFDSFQNDDPTHAGPCGHTPPLSGFPSLPCNFPSRAGKPSGGRVTRWSELRPTLVEALLRGRLAGTQVG
jgi:hypothetical protein